MAKPKPKSMMPTGRASITRLAWLIARWASFGVALALALHMAQPWANAGAPPNQRMDASNTQRTLVKSRIWNSISNYEPVPFLLQAYTVRRWQHPARVREEKEIHNDEAGCD